MAGPRIDRTDHGGLRAVLVVVAALVALVTGACSSGGTGHTSTPRSGPTPASTTGSTPRPATSHRPPRERPFRFRVTQVRQVKTSRLGPVKTQRARRRSVPAITARLDRLFQTAFVRPAVWRTGSYGQVFRGFFAGVARRIALKHPRTLTLGPDAGRRFRSVHGAAGRLKIRILIGRGATVGTAFVGAHFTEKAVQRSGGVLVVVSDGRYFLRHGKRGWWIEGFTVRRHDHRAGKG